MVFRVPGLRAIALAALLLGAGALLLLARAWGRAPRPPVATIASASVAPSSSPPPVADRTPEIRGRVLDADGNVVNGATVRLVSSAPPYSVYREGASDGAGEFSFPHVGPWRVRVVAEHGADGIVTSAILHVSAGETTEVTLVLSAAGAVRGTVVDAQGHAVAGAAISVQGVPWIVPPARSDAAGAFRFTTVPDEATALVAVARGYRTATATLAPRTDDTELVVTLTLTAADPVSGTVVDDDGNPTHARVVACEDQPSEARVTTGDDGTFQLPPSAIGCDAIAEHAEYAPSDAVNVAEGAPLVLRLKAGGAIEGVVVDENGASLAPFALGIESFTPAHGWSFDRVPARSFEDVRGSFRWDRLAPGSYVLTAAAAGRPPSRSGPIDVSRAGVTRGVRIVVPRGGTLTGTVYDESHAPIAGVDVRFDQVSSVIPSKALAQTDASGHYRLDGAPAGPLTLFVHKDGFRAKLVSDLRVDSGATRREDVTLVARDGGPGMELGGIGAVLAQNGAGISLGDVSANDPAARAGLRAGDRILEIDGDSTTGMSLADVLQRLRGEPGTTLWISVLRPDSGERVQIAIERATIVR